MFFWIKREEKTKHTLFCGKGESVWRCCFPVKLMETSAWFPLRTDVTTSSRRQHSRQRQVSSHWRHICPNSEQVTSDPTSASAPTRSRSPGPGTSSRPHPEHHTHCARLSSPHTRTPAHLSATAQAVLLKSSSLSGWFQTRSHFPKPAFQRLRHSHKWQIY